MSVATSVGRRLTALLAVPILGLLRLLRRWIRVKVLIVGSHRFGHLALEPELWLANRIVSQKRKIPLEIHLWSFGSLRTQSNSYLTKLWRERIHQPPSWVTGALVRGGELVHDLALERPKLSIFGPSNGLDRAPQQCPRPSVFSIQELKSLSLLGFDPTKPYVALVVRDSAYYATRGEKENPTSSILNAELSTFIEACEYLVEADLQVIRLGGPSRQQLPLMRGCLDYANSSIRSEELDVKLAMRCSFAISTQSGPDAVALLARRPVLYIDVLRYSQFFFGTKLATWCPIKMYDFNEQRDWSLLRLCSSHLLLAKRPEDFVGSGLTFTRSTSREIRDYVSDYLNEFHQPAETGVADLRALVNASLQRAMGDYGRRTFGDIVAPVSRKWLKDNETWWFDSR